MYTRVRRHKLQAYVDTSQTLMMTSSLRASCIFSCSRSKLKNARCLDHISNAIISADAQASIARFQW